MSVEHYPDETPEVPKLPIEGERRQEQDRRQNDRQGKYDRRRNRCVHCAYFQNKSQTIEEEGFCLYHHSPMSSEAFACPYFTAIPPNSR